MKVDQLLKKTKKPSVLTVRLEANDGGAVEFRFAVPSNYAALQAVAQKAQEYAEMISQLKPSEKDVAAAAQLLASMNTGIRAIEPGGSAGAWEPGWNATEWQELATSGVHQFAAIYQALNNAITVRTSVHEVEEFEEEKKDSDGIPLHTSTSA